MKTVKEIQNSYKIELSDIYSVDEINSLFFIALQEITGIAKIQYLSDKNFAINDEDYLMLNKALNRLAANEPIQYILGKAYFYGMDLEVNEHVLIPRQETEELVHIILQNTDPTKEYNILDIGTGSGCIAIALKKNLPISRVKAIDIDDNALKIAKLNALKYNVEVSFKQMDFLKKADCEKDCKFDIIVSNPPYIKVSEKKLMRKNVLDYEPEKALFVPENNPLIFYEAIVRYASKHLEKGGMLFLEINENHGLETKNLLSHKFQNTSLIKDIHGKDRFIYSQRK